MGVKLTKMNLDAYKKLAWGTHLEQVTVVVHHEQNHQVHFSFGKLSAVDDGT